MNKKTFFVICIIIVTIGGIIVFSMFTGRLNISSKNAILTYSYNNVNINQPLTEDESQVIKEMFNGKRPYTDNPSCGFTKDVSVEFSDMIFCIACDSCPIIKIDNSKKYIKISENERQELEKIFNKYGGSFPCI